MVCAKHTGVFPGCHGYVINPLPFTSPQVFYILLCSLQMVQFLLPVAKQFLDSLHDFSC